MADQLIVGLLIVIITAFFSIIGWLIVRTLSQIDRNQFVLFERMQKIELAIAKITTQLDINDNKLDL